MNPTNDPVQPVAHGEYAGHVEVRAGAAELSQEFWTSIDNAIQQELAALDVPIRRTVASVRAVAGRTSGKVFYLCSYRTFSKPGSDVDPVVVSITFAPAQGGVSLEAGVTGESGGDLIRSFPALTLPVSKEEVVWAARAAARELGDLADSVAAALQDDSRVIE